MIKRTIVGVGIAALFAGLLYLHGTYLMVAAALVGVVAQFEMVETIKSGDGKVMELLAYLFSIFSLPILYLWGYSAILLYFAAMIMCVFTVAILSREHGFESISNTLFTVVYPQFLMIFLYLVIIAPMDAMQSRWMLILAVLAGSGSDIFAYLVGSMMGKKKLCPDISPNKTVEGAIGGLVGGVLCTAVAVFIFRPAYAPWYAYLIAAVVYAVLSQFGDLAASITKRHFGVKDFGSLLPGHGGVMDRICSILFVLPAVVLFFKIF